MRSRKRDDDEGENDTAKWQWSSIHYSKVGRFAVSKSKSNPSSVPIPNQHLTTPILNGAGFMVRLEM